MLLLCAACQPAQRSRADFHASASASAALASALAPRRSGRFVCAGSTCRQPHPRLPDTGEWRCAEREQVVWCAGGEPAAGVMPGAADASFRCGARWGETRERVCIDSNPDYPDAERDHYRCRFEQELGTTRVCERAKPPLENALSEHALPACWLDRDCPSGACDRGTCTCSDNTACRWGRCQAGHCAEASR